MAGKSKPRKKYVPKKINGDIAVNKEYMAFQPLVECIAALRDVVIMKHGKEYAKISIGGDIMIEPALAAWYNCWERICRLEKITADLEPILKLSNKLKYVMPLTHDDIDAAEIAIERTRLIYRSLDKQVIVDHMRTELIKIESDKLLRSK